METLDWTNVRGCASVMQALKAFKGVVSTTDTVLGLLALVKPEGVALLDRLKSRAGKSYIILVENQAKAARFMDEGQKERLNAFMQQHWPGPLTLIVRAHKHLDRALQDARGTVALRVPDHVGLQALLVQVDGLLSTSANLTGGPIPRNVQELDPAIKQKLSYAILDAPARHENSSKVVSSTIVDCSGEHMSLVRAGAYPVGELICWCATPVAQH